MIVFKIGDRYMDHEENDSFTVKRVGDEGRSIGVLYDSGEHSYRVSDDGYISFSSWILDNDNIVKL